MVSSREPKPEVLEDIQKTYGLSIPQGLQILHNRYPLESLSLVDSSSLLYTLSLVVVGNVLALVDTIFSSKKPSIHQLWALSKVVI